MYRPKDHTFIVLMAAIKELFLEFKSMNDGYLSQPNANAFNFCLPNSTKEEMNILENKQELMQLQKNAMRQREKGPQSCEERERVCVYLSTFGKA